MAGEGVRANDAGFNKMIAAGMTDTPKSRWGVNSVLNDPVKDEAADKAKNVAVVADPNAGAPSGDVAVNPEKQKKAIEKAAADAPNPMATPADPATDPAAMAAAANKMDDATSAKAEAKDAAKKAAPKAALAQIRDINGGDPTKIDSVAGPPGAPIGWGVHKLSTEGGNPYAAKQMYRAEEPVPNAQHQPIILQTGVAPAAPVAPVLSPEMQYRTETGEKGVLANNATFKDLVAAGMTATPKVRFNNSVLAPAAADAAPVAAAAEPAAVATAEAAVAAKIAPAAAALMQK